MGVQTRADIMAHFAGLAMSTSTRVASPHLVVESTSGCLVPARLMGISWLRPGSDCLVLNPSITWPDFSRRR